MISECQSVTKTRHVTLVPDMMVASRVTVASLETVATAAEVFSMWSGQRYSWQLQSGQLAKRKQLRRQANVSLRIQILRRSVGWPQAVQVCTEVHLAADRADS